MSTTLLNVYTINHTSTPRPSPSPSPALSSLKPLYRILQHIFHPAQIDPMAALAAPMRQVIKEETAVLLSTAAESLSTSGSLAAREMAVKESPMVAGRVAAEGVVGRGLMEEGVAGARTNVSQHLEILRCVHPPAGPASTPTPSLINPSGLPSIPNAHLHPSSTIPPSTILESLSTAARGSAEKDGGKLLSGGLREAVENALQTGAQEQVELVVDTAQVLGELKTF